MQGSCKNRYEHLATEREEFLERAREAAKLTIPTLIPESGHSKSSDFVTPHQSIGARGVNNLAAKLLISLFPPNSPNFAMKVDDMTLAELAGDDQRASVEKALGSYERSVMTSIEESGDRAAHFEALKHLIVGGNVLLHLPKDTGTRVFALDKYVTVRDPQGTVLEGIIKEEMKFASLDEDLQKIVSEKRGEAEVDRNADIDLYTKFYKDGNKVKSYQEIEGEKVPGTEGSWPAEKSPFIALRWTRIDGEDYGRGYIEEYIGDLNALEGLSKSVLEGSAAAARVIFMVNPNGVTRVADVTEAENGQAISGNADDVTTLQVNKQADMSVAMQTAETVAERLSFAFLLNSAVQRSGERVTAEEIRFMAGELEDALGGVYSLLAQEYQLPYIMRVIDRLTKQGKLPKLPPQIVKPTIVTGLEALGRGHDLNKYDMFLKALAPLGPEVLGQYMNIGDYITRIGTSLGIDIDGLVKSEDQILQERQRAQAQQQQQQMMDLVKPGVGPVAKELAGSMREQGAQPDG